MTLSIPQEDEEAKNLANWLRLHKYKFTHIGNESGQRGTLNIVKMMAKKKKMGVSPGFPDYCIILKCGCLLFIELKRQRKVLKSGKLGTSPSKVSDEQIERIKKLNNLDNIGAYICYGWKESVELIKDIEKNN